MRGPNVAAEWLPRVLLIQEVSDSNFGPEAGCSDRLFVFLISAFRQILEEYLKLGHDRFFPILFNSLYQSTLYNLNS
jgi:hypothetical protein